jgi:hypothetical protein
MLQVKRLEMLHKAFNPLFSAGNASSAHLARVSKSSQIAKDLG